METKESKINKSLSNKDDSILHGKKENLNNLRELYNHAFDEIKHYVLAK